MQATPKRRLPKSFATEYELDDTYQPATERHPSYVQGPVPVDDLAHPRERFYGTVSATIGVLTVVSSCLMLFGFAIAILMALGAYISGGIHLGALRSRAVKVSEEQFPEIYEMVQEYSRQLNIDPPDTYIVCEDGILNA